MKITMTLEELTALVISRYCLPADTSLEVFGGPTSVATSAADRILAIHRAGDCLDTFDNIRPDRKIPAIKLLRDYVAHEVSAISIDQRNRACGLAQAKCAVEEYKNFLAYVRNHGIPPMGADDDVAWRKE